MVGDFFTALLLLSHHQTTCIKLTWSQLQTDKFLGPFSSHNFFVMAILIIWSCSEFNFEIGKWRLLKIGSQNNSYNCNNNNTHKSQLGEGYRNRNSPRQHLWKNRFSRALCNLLLLSLFSAGCRADRVPYNRLQTESECTTTLGIPLNSITHLLASKQCVHKFVNISKMFRGWSPTTMLSN